MGVRGGDWGDGAGFRVAWGAEKQAPSYEAFGKGIGAPGSRVEDYGWEES